MNVASVTQSGELSDKGLMSCWNMTTVVFSGLTWYVFSVLCWNFWGTCLRLGKLLVAQVTLSGRWLPTSDTVLSIERRAVAHLVVRYSGNRLLTDTEGSSGSCRCRSSGGSGTRYSGGSFNAGGCYSSGGGGIHQAIRPRTEIRLRRMCSTCSGVSGPERHESMRRLSRCSIRLPGRIPSRLTRWPR